MDLGAGDNSTTALRIHHLVTKLYREWRPNIVMSLKTIERQVIKEYKDVIEEDQRKRLQDVKKELRCPLCNDTMIKRNQIYECLVCQFELS